MGESQLVICQSTLLDEVRNGAKDNGITEKIGKNYDFKHPDYSNEVHVKQPWKLTAGVCL